MRQARRGPERRTAGLEQSSCRQSDTRSQRSQIFPYDQLFSRIHRGFIAITGIFPYDKKMPEAIKTWEPTYGSVRSAQELGQLMRSHRKSRGWTLQQLAGFANVSMRFLSELERGKETAEIGKTLHALRLLGLEVVLCPRAQVPVSTRARIKGMSEQR